MIAQGSKKRKRNGKGIRVEHGSNAAGTHLIIGRSLVRVQAGPLRNPCNWEGAALSTRYTGGTLAR